MDKKRKEDEISSISGYIQQTNSVKKAKKSETRFFDGTIQISSEEFVRYVSFSPEKVDEFNSAQNMKSPVKLSNIRVTPKDGKKELTFSHNSTIEICRNIGFTRKTQVKPQAAPIRQIIEINQPKMMVSIQAKMSGVLEMKEVDTRYGKKTVQTVVMADSSGIMRLSLWEQNIGKLQLNQCYEITNLISNWFKSYIQLSSTQDTSFSQIEEIKDVVEDFSSLENTTCLTGKIDFCSLTTQLKCMHCTKTLAVTDNQTFAKCEACGAKQKVCVEQMSNVLKFQLKTDDNKKFKLIMFSTAIEKLKESCNLTNKSNDEVEDYLLLQNKLEVKTNKDSDIVNEMSVVKC